MDLTLLKNNLRESGVIDAIKSVCADKTECYLVGGAIRDCLSGLPISDYDFCFPDNPTEFARQIAAQLGATFFILDEERGHSRFVLKKESGKVSCDFAPFRAPSLESDLRKRDFTINAMAVLCSHGDLQLIDPLHGQDDLARKQLRACSEYSFQDDPLRCLKGIRHAACLDLEVEPETMQRLVSSVPQIDQVASERIRTELAKAISCKKPSRTFQHLKETGILVELFGRASDQAFADALEILARYENTVDKLKTGVCGQVVIDFLSEPCEEYVPMEIALKLAAFLYGYRPVALKSVLQALRFSNRTINLIEQIRSIDAEILSDFVNVATKKRSRARWLSGTGNEPLATAIFMALLTDNESTDLLTSELLIDAYSASLVNGRLAELVSGDWLTDNLGLAEGPAIGRALEQLHLAEINGEVCTRDEAMVWLQNNQKSIDKNF
jgi:poly(A) polymerase